MKAFFGYDKTVSRMVLAFDVWLIIGSVAYAALLFVVSVVYPFGHGDLDYDLWRLELMHTGDTILAATVYVFLAGQIACAVVVMVRRLHITAKMVITYYISQVALAVLSVLPFVFVNSSRAYDYLTPAFGIVGNLAAIILLFYISARAKARVDKMIEKI